jgi:hypothetical protein
MMDSKKDWRITIFIKSFPHDSPGIGILSNYNNIK